MRFFSKKKEEPPAIKEMVFGHAMEVRSSGVDHSTGKPIVFLDSKETEQSTRGTITATLYAPSEYDSAHAMFKFLGHSVFASYDKAGKVSRLQIDIGFAGHITAECGEGGKIKVNNGMKNPPVNSAYSGEVQVPGWSDEKAEKLANAAWKKAATAAADLKKLREDPVVKAALEKVA